MDIFFVIAGFLTTKSILKRYGNGEFSYWSFESERLYRLWPLTILICCLVFLLGYFFFLPYNFKDCSEQTVGSLLFGNNVVQYITSGNYWDLNNLNKPLMHLWYLGVLMEFYLIYPLIFVAFRHTSHRDVKLNALLWLIFVGSILIFFSSTTNEAFDFYLLPSRLFEFAAGGIIAVPLEEKHKRNWTLIVALSFVILLLVLNIDFEQKQFRVLFVVCLTCLVIKEVSKVEILNSNCIAKFFATFGIASFSLYLTHQPLLAFYRYFCGEIDTFTSYTFVLLGCFSLGLITYYSLEKLLSRYLKYKNTTLSICALIVMVMTITSVHFYKLKGVVRDVPQQDIFVNDPQSYEPQDYNSRNSAFDHDFVVNGKKNILVIGDSFGRDWINVMRESGVDSIANISYRTIQSPTDYVLNKRIEKADIIFIASNQTLDSYQNYLPRIMRKKYYVVGAKNFAQCGPYYIRLRWDDYRQMHTFESQKVKELNETWKEAFGKNFFDLLSVIRNTDGSIPMFTPDGKFFSHDAIHFTRAGAKYCASHINIKELID